jgi:hypothetical protein
MSTPNETNRGDDVSTLHPDETDKKPCKACGSRIPKQAAVCSVCKSYQSSWKSNLIFFGTLTGLGTFALAAMSLIGKNYIDIEERFRHHDMELHHLRTQIYPEVDAVFSNSWPEPIFIDELVLNWRDQFVRYRINQQIKSKEFLSIERIVSPKNDKDIAAAYSEFIARSFAANSTGMRGRALQSISLTVLISPDRDSNCFVPVFFTATSADLDRIKKDHLTRGKKLISEPANADFVYYVSSPGIRKTKNVAAVITFAQSIAKNCATIDLE